MSISKDGRPAMAAKKRKRRKAGRRKKKPVAKRASKPKRRKARKTRKRRKAPVAHAKPVKRRKKRTISAAHLAKMKAGREAAAARKRKHGPQLTARMGESARGPHYMAPPKMVRHPIRNPAKQWYKFCVHSGADYTEQVGYGTRSEAEAKAKALLRSSRKVELLGPYFTKAMAEKAA